MKEHQVYSGSPGMLIDFVFVAMFVIVRLGVGKLKNFLMF